MRAHPLPAAALESRIAIVGTAGSGKTYAAKGMAETLIDAHARVCIIDPLGVWFGLRLAADGAGRGFDVVIFGGDHADVPLDEASAPALAEIIGTADLRCVVDLSALDGFTTRKRFMKAFAEALYKHNREPLHLILDEADLWAPQRPIPDGVSEILKNRIDEIVRRGRVKGFVPWLITQRPAVIHKDILSQLDTLVAFKLTSSQDRDALGAWLEGQADKARGRDIIASLPRMARGQAVAWSPGFDMLETIRFPANRSFDSSRTPTRGERRDGVTLAPIDLGALRERLAVATAHAADNDPKAMKATIAALRQKLAAGAAPDAATIAKVRAEAFHAGAIQARRMAADAVRSAAVRAAADAGALARQIEAGEWIQAPPGGADAGPADRAPAAPTPIQRPAGAPGGGNGAEPAVADRRRWFGGHLRVVKVLAERHPEAFGRRAVATLAGFHPGGGTFAKYLSVASTEGLIERDGDQWRATASGRAKVAGLPPVAPTPDALLATWREAIGGGGCRRMFDTLIAEYPRALDRANLADVCRMQAKGGTFLKYLSVLRANGLAVVTGRRISAAPLLFE